MQKLIKYVLLFCLTINTCLANTNCDWTLIKKNADGTYTYPEALHLCVGSLKKQVANQQQQLTDLQSAITLKDLALVDSQKQTALWQSTAMNLEDKMQKIDSDQHRNDFLYFGLGVLGTVATGFAIGSLVKHQ